MIKNICFIIFASTLLTIYNDGSCATIYSHKNNHIKLKPPAEEKQQAKPESKEEQKSPLTGSFIAASNYMFRGISQTSNLPTFQGGLTFTILKYGAYVSLWGSNVNFLDVTRRRPTTVNRLEVTERTATLEVDEILGVRNSVGDNFTYDISIQRYNYPRTSGLDYNELIINLTYRFLTALIGYSNNVLDTGGDGLYVNLGAKFDIPPKYIFNLNNISISGGIGHYHLPESRDLRSYNDYNIQLSKTMCNYQFAIQWTDTNGRSVDKRSLTDSHILAIVTVTF